MLRPIPVDESKIYSLGDAATSSKPSVSEETYEDNLKSLSNVEADPASPTATVNEEEIHPTLSITMMKGTLRAIRLNLRMRISYGRVSQRILYVQISGELTHSCTQNR